MLVAWQLGLRLLELFGSVVVGTGSGVFVLCITAHSARLVTKIEMYRNATRRRCAFIDAMLENSHWLFNIIRPGSSCEPGKYHGERRWLAIKDLPQGAICVERLFIRIGPCDYIVDFACATIRPRSKLGCLRTFIHVYVRLAQSSSRMVCLLCLGDV